MGGFFSSPYSSDLPNNVISIDSTVSPNNLERQAINAINNLIFNQKDEMLNKLYSYNDASQEIRNALVNHTDEILENTWNAVFPNIEFIEKLYDFSVQLSNQVIFCLSYLADQKISRSINSINESPSIVIVLIKCLDLALNLDTIKGQLPKMNGDLAYFRRVAARRPDFSIIDELYLKSTQISLFYGNGSPILANIVTLFKKTFGRNPEKKEMVLKVIGETITVCASNVKNHCLSQSSNIICLRGLTTGLLLYDILGQFGAFHQNVSFQVIESLNVLFSHQPFPNELINTIKYCSKHLNDQRTIPCIKELFL